MYCPGLAVAIALAPQSARNDMVRYAVRPGETVETIAARALRPACASDEIRRLNRMPEHAALAAGQILTVPRFLLRTAPATATVEVFRGQVHIDARPAAVGEAVSEGALVSTGANASVRLALSDGSRLALPSNSRVRIDRLRLTLLTGALDRAITVLDGRTESTVTPMTDPTGRYLVRTPVAVSAVRGTVFRATYDAAGRQGTTGVLKGAVMVAGEGRSSLPKAGEGVTASPAGVSDPKALLPAPVLLHAERMQVGAAAGFDIRPQSGAVRHRVLIASDPELTRTVFETEQAEPHVSLNGLADGDYVAKVSEVAAGGLEGLATLFAFTRQSAELTGLAVREERGLGSRRYTFLWSLSPATTAAYRFTLSRLAPGRPPERVQEIADLKAGRAQAADLPPGVYAWQVVATWSGPGGKPVQVVSEPQSLTIDPKEP